MKRFLILVVAMLFVLQYGFANNQFDYLDDYNVVWNTPSKDKTGQMPTGNGDIGAGVYAIEGDSLYLLLSKNDALIYSGDIFKTGGVKVSIKPNPFEKGKNFKQTLDIKTSAIYIEADDVKIKVWADANKNVYHIELSSLNQIEANVDVYSWDRIDSNWHNRTKAPLDKPTQDVVIKDNNSIITYYAVGDRSLYDSDIKYYEVEDMKSKYPDPFKFNTFGNLISSEQLKLEDDVLKGKGKYFDIRIFAKANKESDTEKWLSELKDFSKETIYTPNDWQKHCKWWDNFWSRSKIELTDNKRTDPLKLDSEGYKAFRKVNDEAAMVSQAYNVFRYLMAAQSRGKIQTKFNGGIFTQPLRYKGKPRTNSPTKINDNLYISHEDERLWGRRFTWQNQRLLYWQLLTSGDYDLMKPFFDYYLNLLPMRMAITKQWFGHEGAYYRENIELTGAERDCAPSGDKRKNHIEEKPIKVGAGENNGQFYFHSFYFTSGLEAVAMMIEYVKHSSDYEFANEKLVPFARQILTFYDKHYARDENAKLRLDPAQVLETIFSAVNPTNDIAGLQYNLDELIKMNLGTPKDKENWERLRSEIPEIPMDKLDEKLVIAPAQIYQKNKNKNKENGCLYAVFPFTKFGVALGTKDIVENTMHNRSAKNLHTCWSQDGIHWAYAGNANEAKNSLIARFKTASDMCRFPLYGKENPDSCPDFDHFGSGSIALQKMLVQESEGKIVLFPAFPKDWNVDFKLHLRDNTIVEATLENGKILKLEVSPKSRRKDIIINDSFELSN